MEIQPTTVIAAFVTDLTGSTLWVDSLSTVLTVATGFEFDTAALGEAGERIYALERAFNVRQGITRKDDRFPQKPEVKETPQGKEELEKHTQMPTEYYQVRGYDSETGIPTVSGWSAWD